MPSLQSIPSHTRVGQLQVGKCYPHFLLSYKSYSIEVLVYEKFRQHCFDGFLNKSSSDITALTIMIYIYVNDILDGLRR